MPTPTSINQSYGLFIETKFIKVIIRVAVVLFKMAKHKPHLLSHLVKVAGDLCFFIYIKRSESSL